MPSSPSSYADACRGHQRLRRVGHRSSVRVHLRATQRNGGVRRADVGFDLQTQGLGLGASPVCLGLRLSRGGLPAVEQRHPDVDRELIPVVQQPARA